MPRIAAENAVVLLVDLQKEIVAGVQTIPEAQLRRSISVLLQAADSLAIPIVCTGVPLGPGATPEMIEEAGRREVLARITVSGLDDRRVREDIVSTGRKVVALAGVSTEVSVVNTALNARELGYEVHVLLDACGGLNTRAEQSALLQIQASGAVLSSVATFLSSLIVEMTSQEGQRVMGALATFWS